jgi:hypothetical protein
VNPAGTINTIAGTGRSGFSGDYGPATLAALSHPQGIALDTAGRGNLYIGDANNSRIRQVGIALPIEISLTTNPGAALASGFVGTASSANTSEASFYLATQSTVTIVLKDRYAVDESLCGDIPTSCIDVTNKSVVTLPAGNYSVSMTFPNETLAVTPN